MLERWRCRAVARLALASGVFAAMALSGPSAHADPNPNVSLRLTTQPVGAQIGEKVTHVIQLAATDMPIASQVKVYFTSTVPLAQVEVKSESGTCQPTTESSIICDVAVAPDAATPSITIAGVLTGSAAAGSVVHNIATLVSQQDGDASDNSSANGYLLTQSGPVDAPPPAAGKNDAAVAHIPPVSAAVADHTADSVDRWSWVWGGLKIAAIIACIAGGVLLVVRGPMGSEGADPTRWPGRGKHRRRPQWMILVERWRLLAQPRMARVIEQARLISQRLRRNTATLGA